MAKKTPRLKVVVSPRALRSLDEIWDYNAETYGADHAHAYITWLRLATAKLATDYPAGKPVPTRPDFHYITKRRGRKRGAGHVIVYQVLQGMVEVLCYYHTSQDWQNNVSR